MIPTGPPSINPKLEGCHLLHLHHHPQPKRRRYRIPRSCDRCRTSKIKCVFQNGQCAACVSARVPCTFANPGSLKERPPTQKDLEHLQARIRSLERLIHAIDPNLDLSNLISQPIQPNPSIHHTLLPTSSLTLPDLTPSLPATQQPPPVQSKPQDLLKLSNSNLNSLFNPSRVRITDFLPEPLARLEDLSPVDLIIRRESHQNPYSHQDFYPEFDLEQDLFRIYFQDVHPFCPLLHPPTFFQDQQAGKAKTHDSFRALCLMVCAIASRFSKDPRVYCDLVDHPQTAAQAAGLRYSMTAGPYLFRLVPNPAGIHDLQALVLLSLYLFGAAGPDVVWYVVGTALQRAQDVGAHIEDHPQWSKDPILDHSRRKCFFTLYEFDHILSSALGKPSFMQESDFDILPADLEYDVSSETFSNPFFSEDDRTPYHPSSIDVCLAYLSMKSSLGGLKNLLPVITAMSAHREHYPGAKFSDCIKSLIHQLDLSMNKSFETVRSKISSHFDLQEPHTISRFDLISSALVVSWYHEFRLLIYRILFNYKEKRRNSTSDSKDTPLSNDGALKSSSSSSSRTEYPFLDICVESAQEIIAVLKKLKDQNLLQYGFFWIPLRAMNAIVVLICSLNKQRRFISVDQRHQRCSAISLGIEILNRLAPSTHLARQCSMRVVELYQHTLHLEQQNPRSNHPHSSSSSSPPVFSSSSSPAAGGPTTDSSSYQPLGSKPNDQAPGEERMTSHGSLGLVSETRESDPNDSNRARDPTTTAHQANVPAGDPLLASMMMPTVELQDILKDPFLVSANTFDFNTAFNMNLFSTLNPK